MWAMWAFRRRVTFIEGTSSRTESKTKSRAVLQLLCPEENEYCGLGPPSHATALRVSDLQTWVFHLITLRSVRASKAKNRDCPGIVTRARGPTCNRHQSAHILSRIKILTCSFWGLKMRSPNPVSCM